MASPALPTLQSIDLDNESDYGSDFSPEESLIVEHLLSNPTLLCDIEDNPIVSPIEHNAHPQSLRLPRTQGHEERSPPFHAARAAEQVAEQILQSVAHGKYYPDSMSSQFLKTINLTDAQRLVGIQVRDEIQIDSPAPIPENSTIEQVNKEPDSRSPLERFRTQPKKALSVTDLVSPAWCELQYWYTLTLHGRKRRTPAMKRGSDVHQVLEDQVHRTVQVDIQTKEDAWGLRIWNVIQGLRTLRQTGLTRELEIWGTIDGLVVNGIIDELSYECPDPELEASLSEDKSKRKPTPELPPDQPTISEFFKSRNGNPLTLSEAMQAREPPQERKKIYLCDVKTRSATSLPSKSAFRPTQMQLMLYHHLLSSLAANKVDFSTLTARYTVDAEKPFSDSFIAQIGSLNDEFYMPSSSISSSPSLPSTQSSTTLLLAHNSLAPLWSLMISEFALTLPPSSLGHVLKAEYRSSSTGEILGAKVIAMDERELTSYLEHEMQWWKGERKAEGVKVEEAFKCRSCEFAEGCEWRVGKVEEAVKKARAGRRKTVV